MPSHHVLGVIPQLTPSNTVFDFDIAAEDGDPGLISMWRGDFRQLVWDRDTGWEFPFKGSSIEALEGGVRVHVVCSQHAANEMTLYWYPEVAAVGPAGADGEDGQDGATWRSGSGAPSDGVGADGDFYLRTDTGDVYTRAGGSYSITANMKGPTGNTGATGSIGATGAQGPSGAAGATGAPGAVWRSGSGAPSNGTGIDGDYYLRTDTSDVYLRAAGTYSVVTNIKGATGATGSTPPLSSATPTTVGTTSAAGSGTNASRDDHIHAMPATITTTKSNTTPTLATANAGLVCENPAAGGQSQLVFAFSGTPKSGLRFDESGTANYACGAGGYHQLYASLDTSAPIMNARTTGVLIGGAAGGSAAAKLDVIGAVAGTPVGRFKAAASQSADVLQAESSSGTADLFSVTAAGNVKHSLQSSAASVSQTQGSGALTRDVNVITPANANDTVTLPGAAAALEITIVNASATHRLKVYPASGDNLGNGVNVPCSIPPGGARRWLARDSTNWAVTFDSAKTVTLAELVVGGAGTGLAGSYPGQTILVAGQNTLGDGYVDSYWWSLSIPSGLSSDFINCIPGVNASGYWVKGRPTRTVQISGAGSTNIACGTCLVEGTSGTPIATLWDSNLTPGFTVIVRNNGSTSISVGPDTLSGAGHMAFVGAAGSWYRVH